MSGRIARSVSSIFCDDIRLEIGNKLSLIGVYSGGLVVQQFPLVLPKLGILLTVVAPIEERFKTLKLRLLKNDDPLFEQVVDPAILAQEEKAPDEDEIKYDLLRQRLCIYMTPIVLSPFVVDQPMILRVRVDADGEELKGPALTIRKAR